MDRAVGGCRLAGADPELSTRTNHPAGKDTGGDDADARGHRNCLSDGNPAPHTQQRAALILCDVLDWSAKDAADLLDLSVPAVNSALQRARVRLREHLPSQRPPWPAGVDGSTAERDLLKKYVEASESADFQAFESIIRADAIFRMPPEPGTAAGRDAIFKLWMEGGFGSERFGRVRCLVTHANLQPAVACYRCPPGDSIWRALALDILRIEDGMITEIVAFVPENFPAFGLPMTMEAAPEMNKSQNN